MLSRDNDYYFYLGGVISLGSFFVFSSLFFFFILQQTPVKQIEISSSEYISVNLNTITTAPPKKVTSSIKKKSVSLDEKPLEQKSTETDEKALESVSVPQKVNTDLAALFGEVKTSQLVKRNSQKKAVVDEKFLKKLDKRIETKNTKPVASDAASSLVRNLKLSKQNIQVVGDSVGVKDEYLAKIHSEIYARFHPISNLTAKVRLEIDAFGNLLLYKVLAYSNDALFNEAVDNCLRSLDKFPINPDNTSIVIDVILTGKE